MLRITISAHKKSAETRVQIKEKAITKTSVVARLESSHTQFVCNSGIRSTSVSRHPHDGAIGFEELALSTATSVSKL